MGNISKIRIQNTDYAIKDSRVDNKVDKVSSTDNAVVRFDGSSGAVQNSGVTINDSNHLTAAKLITSGGTSSQVVLGNGTLQAADTLPQYEAYLKWGGKNISSGYSPIDASMIGELGANRLAFPNAGGITVEYSRDSGTTWTDYQTTDDKKVGLFSGINQNFIIGKAASNDVASNTYQLRIKIVAGSGSSAVGVYTQLNKFVFYVSTSGSTGCWCTLKGRTAANYNNNVETYSTYADQVAIGGWSGYNIINTSSITFGTNDTQTKEITFTFGCTGYNGNGTTNVGLSIYKIFCFGGVGLTEPSNMAQHGHLYYWDSTQNMITPAGVYPKTSSTYNLGSTSFFWKEAYANKFVTKNGTSSQFVKGDGSLDSTTYAPLTSPALTGTPTAPTAASGTNTTQIATTAFVKSEIAGKADAATTLAGYGITDAKIESGVITLGSNSVTPLKKLSGTTAERPINVSVGDCYFDTDLGKDIYVKEVNDSVVTWVDSNGFSAVPTKGTTTNRTDLFENHDMGFEYFDTSLKTQVYLNYTDNIIVTNTVLYTEKSAYSSNPFLEGDKLYVRITKNQAGTDTLTLAFCKTNDGTFEDAIYLDASVVISNTAVNTSIVSAPDPSVYPYIYNAFTSNTNHFFRWTKRNTNWIPSQSTDNLVTSVSSSSTDDQYPSAKCVYDLVGNIETLLASI